MALRFTVAVLLLAVIGVSYYLGSRIRPVTSDPLALPPLIVIDPGHGGYDGGAQRDGIFEKHINLEVALILRELLLASGYRVVMTRYGDYSLIDGERPTSGPRKTQDMQRRLAVIEKNNADLVIMLHCNAMASSRWAGGQVFYQRGYDQGELLAQDIQYFLGQLTDTTREFKPGDFYLLRESTKVGALVELGFISNARERALLQETDYQRRLAMAIWLGITRFMSYPDGH